MSAQAPASFDDLNEQAVRRFLQTALVVDDHVVTAEDRAEQEGSGEPLTAVIEPDAFTEDELPPLPEHAEEAAESSAEDGGSESSADQAGDEQEVTLRASQIDVKVVADAFADEGLTCGVLQPKGETNSVERIVTAGARADIVVIDWRLSDDTGKTAADAVAELVEKSATGKRLIAIYTTQTDLGKIALELCRRLELEESEDLVIDAQGARIEILNKVGVKPQDPRRQLSEGELPRFLVGRFKELVRGLVPIVALNALAATRENTHRLLERLGPTLDLGYAGHLLRIEHLEDGQQHLLDAVGGELRVIVNDDGPARAAAGREGLLAWIRARDADGQLATSVANLEAHLDPALEKSDGKTLKSTSGRKPRDYSALLAPDDEAAVVRRSDAHFAMLMSLLHHYEWPRPMLTLGTVVRETSEEGWYWLCVQPVCDAVRLTGPTAFPMLQLDVVEPDKHGFHIVVADPGSGEPVYLWAASKPRDMRLIRIAPTEQESVRFHREKSGELAPVRTEENFSLEWIAQLKPVHAQRSAEDLGGEFSRVGLDESEWLRLQGKEGKKPPATSRITGGTAVTPEQEAGVPAAPPGEDVAETGTAAAPPKAAAAKRQSSSAAPGTSKAKARGGRGAAKKTASDAASKRRVGGTGEHKAGAKPAAAKRGGPPRTSSSSGSTPAGKPGTARKTAPSKGKNG